MKNVLVFIRNYGIFTMIFGLINLFFGIEIETIISILLGGFLVYSINRKMAEEKNN